MKSYKIESPEQLRSAIPLMKDARAAKSTGNIAAVWSVATRQGKPNAFSIYIRIGRNAVLCREHEKREIVLGDMRLLEARDFVSGLKLREGGSDNADH